MKTFLWVLLAVVLTLVALKFCPLIGLPVALALAVLAVIGAALAGSVVAVAAAAVVLAIILLGFLLVVVAVLSPVWIPVLAVIGIVALVRHGRAKAT